jgi:hypothetical protein
MPSPNCAAANVSRYAGRRTPPTAQPFEHFRCEACLAPVVVGPISARTGPRLCSTCRGLLVTAYSRQREPLRFNSPVRV